MGPFGKTGCTGLGAGPARRIDDDAKGLKMGAGSFGKPGVRVGAAEFRGLGGDGGMCRRVRIAYLIPL